MYYNNVDEKIGMTEGEARQYVESLPYWAETISRGSMTQTIWDEDGDPVLQRSLTAEGIGSNQQVIVGNWYRP